MTWAFSSVCLKQIKPTFNFGFLASCGGLCVLHGLILVSSFPFILAVLFFWTQGCTDKEILSLQATLLKSITYKIYVYETGLATC